MSEIPEDVMKAAVTACHEAGAKTMGVPFLPSVACIAAARAIMAERERCADIVDAECERVLSKQDGKDPAIDTNLRLIAVLLPDLAAAIRGKP